jgi:hypothetical protein
MANYRKSFNLRNGVQVDDDNFIVNANGLVGIGTSIPTEFLDVRGNVKVVGLVTASRVSTPNLQVTGVGTFTTLTDGTVRISSGIVTASSGIVTYYGDGKGLTNIPTSQWVDVNTGTGYSSIYAAGTVGIANTMPNYFLQVGGNPDTVSGVGINSTGDIKLTGIITASSFVGSGIGITQINASNISSGTLSNSILPSNINVSGVITATSGFSGNVVGNVTGTATTAQSLTGTPNITVGVVTATKIIADSIEVNAFPSGITTISKLLHVGTGGTAFAALESGRIGVGTAAPTSELQIRKSDNTLVEVISDTSQARISIGQSVGVGKSTAVLRFGNESKTFDIVNNDTGNINTYLHAGPAGVGTGRFAWLYGQSNAELVSLTYNGNFGIGITNPTNKLHVVGTSTVTGNANFGSNVTINGNLTAGSLTLPPVLTNVNLNNSSGISTFNDIKSSRILSIVQIGINTANPLAEIDARDGTLLVNRIGIGTTVANVQLDVQGGTLLVDSVGVGTTSIYVDPLSSFSSGVQFWDKFISVYGGGISLYGDSTIGFNTDFSRSILDFGRVGSAATVSGYFIVPTITTANRNQLSNNTGIGGTIEGAIIYNSTTKKHQGYGSTDNGVTFGWQNLY